MRAAFLGPAGTNSHEALLAAGLEAEYVGFATVAAVVGAVQDGSVDRALVPIENSREGGVGATLDALVFDAPDVLIVGELVHRVSYCLAAAEPIAPDEVRTVHSHPQATGQCARFLAEQLPAAVVVSAASTADAVRAVAEGGALAGAAPHAAIGTRHAARLYGATVLAVGIEDEAENATRFAWIARAPVAATPSPPDTVPSPPGTMSRPPATAAPPPRETAAPPPRETAAPLPPGTAAPPPPGTAAPPPPGTAASSPPATAASSPPATAASSPPATAAPPPPGTAASSPPAVKTALVFWGGGDLAPGWLVDCLTEFSSRAINLTRIESRPRRVGLGHYMFFCDLEGAASNPDVAAAIARLRSHCEAVRVLGSFPASR
jgi:prephenate dehydratase